MATVLVLDDDPNILAVIETRLESNGYTVEAFSDPLEALERTQNKSFDLIVTDVRMPKLDGMEFLHRVRSHSCRNIPVIVLTAYGTIPNAVEAVKGGAFQYLTKPFQGKELLDQVALALEENKSRVNPSIDKGPIQLPKVFCQSDKMKALFPILERIAMSASTVLIQGESGTGKELVARMIHSTGPRKGNNFVVMDCGSTPATLIESELFGHTKGAFTGATESRKGVFESADSGTLFLDEIGCLPLDLQTRLLRALQEGQIKRVGESQMRKVDVRVVAATNVDLKDEVKAGRFRLDLYYRLAVLNVEVPPLRERQADIPLLASHFLQQLSQQMKRSRMKFGENVVDTLTCYDWPGNIRQLRNMIEAAVVLSHDESISVADLHCAGLPRDLSSCSTLATSYDSDDQPEAATQEVPLAVPNIVEQHERKLILKALEENNWVQRRAAKQLRISPRVINYKIKKFNIGTPA